MFLVNVFEDLHKQNKRYRLVIIGDGDERGAIESYIDSHELSKAVILLSNRSDVNRYYNAFDFFALPSLFEGLGRVLLEAQCNGLPCFASKGTIANEVKVLSTFKFVELNSKESWVDTIISSPCHREKDAEKEIVSAGYEIRNTIDYLQKHYVEMGAT